MDSSLGQAIDNANQANLTMEWVLFAVFVAPIALVIIAIPVAIIGQRRLKCPQCGSWRKNKSSLQVVRTVEGNKTTVARQRVVVCRKCKNEFTI
jgi:DNA-directed RNA polymerase subunit RPC12/RpoP